MFGRYAWTCEWGDIKEPAASQVPVKQPWLLELLTSMTGIHLGIDVPVSNDNVFPSVIIDVQRRRPPSQIFGVNRQAGRNRCIFKLVPTQVAVEGMGIISKICLKNVQQSASIEVCRGRSHAGLGTAIFVV